MITVDGHRQKTWEKYIIGWKALQHRLDVPWPAVLAARVLFKISFPVRYWIFAVKADRLEKECGVADELRRKFFNTPEYGRVYSETLPVYYSAEELWEYVDHDVASHYFNCRRK